MGLALYGTGIPTSRSTLTNEPWAKVVWFVHSPLADALNLAHFPASAPVALIVAVVILVGLMRHFPGSIPARSIRLAIAAALVPLSYLPSLLISESWSAYRTQVALTSLLALYAVSALQGFAGRLLNTARLTYLVAALAFGSCIAASAHVVKYFVLPQSIELALLRHQLDQVDAAARRALLIRQASPADSVAPAIAYDEFGMPSTASPWAPRPMAALLLRERHIDHRQLVITVCAPDAPLDAPRDTAIVDMRRLAAFK
jgi:hypothetical protein